MALIEDIFAENILDEPDELEHVEENVDQIDEYEANDDPDDDAEEGNKDEKDDDKKDIQKKRRVSQRPKLNILRLMNTQNGLMTLENVFNDVKFKGKGYEREDLNLVMRNMEIWTHQLFPSLQFDDCLGKLEKLGHNKSVMTYLTKIRLGMEDSIPTTDEVIEERNDSDDELKRDSLNSAFDRLINSQSVQNNQSQPVTNAISSGLTAEQRERMIKNRLIAEQRRLARLKARQEQLPEPEIVSSDTMEITRQEQLPEPEIISSNTMEIARQELPQPEIISSGTLDVARQEQLPEPEIISSGTSDVARQEQLPQSEIISSDTLDVARQEQLPEPVIISSDTREIARQEQLPEPVIISSDTREIARQEQLLEPEIISSNTMEVVNEESSERASSEGTH